MSLFIYEISDSYIEYLRSCSVLSRYVMDAKRTLDFSRFTPRTRKYLGILLSKEIFNIKNELSIINYFVPLSSGKKNDYIVKDDKYILDENGHYIPKPDKLTIIRLVNKNSEVMGKLLLNNMLPVPISQISKYDPKNEKDRKYAEKVINEIRAIHQKEQKILHNAKILYNLKTGKNDLTTTHPFLKDVLPFSIAESKYFEFIAASTKDND